MNRKLLALLAGNAKRGEFRAEGNTIYLYDVIVAADADAEWFGGVSAESFVQTLRGMSGAVDVRINSPGGDVFGAKAMAAAIREYPGLITAHVDGIAASAATFLTSVADKTVMAEGSMLMIHKAWTFAIGNADELHSLANVMDKIDGTIAETYASAASKRGAAASDFAALMAAETWYTPDEAIAAGLADEQAPEKVKAKVDWDLSAYEHAPAAQAPVADPVEGTTPTRRPRPMPHPTQSMTRSRTWSGRTYRPTCSSAQLPERTRATADPMAVSRRPVQPRRLKQ
jgi:ATP-dependent protease ClpP protease subunit